MKAKITLGLFLTAIIMVSSCGTISPPAAPSATSAEYVAGNTFGSALKSLYSQYKSQGKIVLNNQATILNLATLATSGAAIKGLGTNTSNYKNFATGVIAGSTNLINNNTVNNVISSVNNLNLSSVVNALNNNTITPTTTSSVTNSLVSILGMMGNK